jgi:hypothetical protein
LSIRQPQVGAGEAAGGAGSFFDTLQKSMEEVNENQVQADGAI